MQTVQLRGQWTMPGECVSVSNNSRYCVSSGHNQGLVITHWHVRNVVFFLKCCSMCALKSPIPISSRARPLQGVHSQFFGTVPSGQNERRSFWHAAVQCVRTRKENSRSRLWALAPCQKTVLFIPLSSNCACCFVFYFRRLVLFVHVTSSSLDRDTRAIRSGNLELFSQVYCQSSMISPPDTLQ